NGCGLWPVHYNDRDYFHPSRRPNVPYRSCYNSNSDRSRPRSHRRCGTARSDFRGRWPYQLVATAAENRLNIPAQPSHVVAVASHCQSNRKLESRRQKEERGFFFFQKRGGLPVRVAFVLVDRGDWWSWDHICGVLSLDVMVQPTDADRELLYLPQAMEEDHGAPFKKLC